MTRSKNIINDYSTEIIWENNISGGLRGKTRTYINDSTEKISISKYYIVFGIREEYYLKEKIYVNKRIVEKRTCKDLDSCNVTYFRKQRKIKTVEKPMKTRVHLGGKTSRIPQ